MSQFLNSIGRMGRGGRPPRRGTTPTPTSATFQEAPMAQQQQQHQQTQRQPSPQPEVDDDWHQDPPPLYMCQPFVRAALVKGNFKTIVMLPKYCDVQDWVAMNIFDFHNNLNMFYGVISEFCTSATCPTMSAGPNLDYTWIDHTRKHVKLPAANYIDFVFTWIQQTLDNGRDFPTKMSQEYPPNFPSTAKHIYRQLLRVFAHIYHAHYPILLHLSSEPHFNSLFAHFLAFGKQYDLLDTKDIIGAPPQHVGVGELWRKWRTMGILDS